MPSNGPEITLDTRAQEYAKQLKNRSDPRGPLTYLANHGISDREVMSRYSLGIVLDPLPGDERFRGSISIPYIGRRGVMAVRYRCALSHDCHSVIGHSKYAQYEGSKAKLYNISAFFAAGNTIGITEGEVDAILATEVLGIPTIGLPGATQWASYSKIWQECFRDFDKIIIFADGDDAGRSSARTIAADFGTRYTLVKCDSGEDVSSMIVNGHTDRLRRMAGVDDDEG